MGLGFAIRLPTASPVERPVLVKARELVLRVVTQILLRLRRHQFVEQLRVSLCKLVTPGCVYCAGGEPGLGGHEVDRGANPAGVRHNLQVNRAPDATALR